MKQVNIAITLIAALLLTIGLDGVFKHLPGSGTFVLAGLFAAAYCAYRWVEFIKRSQT